MEVRTRGEAGPVAGGYDVAGAWSASVDVSGFRTWGDTKREIPQTQIELVGPPGGQHSITIPAALTHTNKAVSVAIGPGGLLFHDDTELRVDGVLAGGRLLVQLTRKWGEITPSVSVVSGAVPRRLL
jgi:hypothetical protein